jgi:Circularly permutated YpsA SLOG family
LLPEAHRLTIISGGQTGVDRAALDVALAVGLPCGGWCPRGRRAEDGAISDRYPLQETPSPFYPVRTRWNVRDADATLILTRGQADRGTALTCAIAEKMAKPLLVIDVNQPVDFGVIREWLETQKVRRLNVAGPRESSQPGIQAQAVAILRALLNSGAV